VKVDRSKNRGIDVAICAIASGWRPRAVGIPPLRIVDLA
jgi:hypothetical protein